MQRHLLAGAGGGRAQQGQIQHGRQLALQVVDGCGGAREARVGEVEMVTLVHRQRLAGGQAGADGRGAGDILAPLRAQVEAGAAQVAGVAVMAQKIHRHAMAVGQQQHIVQALELLVEALEPAAGNADQRLGLFSVGAQLAGGHDMGFAGAARVQPVLVDAAAPAAQHGPVACFPLQRVAHAKGFELLDMGGIAVDGHGGSPAITGLILCPRPGAANQANPQQMLQCKRAHATGVASAAAVPLPARCWQTRNARPWWKEVAVQHGRLAWGLQKQPSCGRSAAALSPKKGDKP